MKKRLSELDEYTPEGLRGRLDKVPFNLHLRPWLPKAKYYHLKLDDGQNSQKLGVQHIFIYDELFQEGEAIFFWP